VGSMEVEQTGVVAPTGGGGVRRVPHRSEPVGLADWRGDVALELWVEVDVEPVRIRMAGRLDATTAANLDDVVVELLADGTRHISLCTDGLRVVDARPSVRSPTSSGASGGRVARCCGWPR